MAISTLYYFKERQRIFQEHRVKARMEYAKCKRLEKLMKQEGRCQMALVTLSFDDLKGIYLDILYALLASLPIIGLLSYLLARLSLRPMRESVAAMDSFINGIVHDINTPLSVVRMSAQGIKKQVDDPKLEGKIKRLIQGVDQIQSLEEQLLFSIKIGEYTLEKEHFELSKLLQEREPYYALLRSSITLHVESEPLEIYADRAAIMRMVDNIVINSIKYSHADGRVSIILKGDRLMIIDEGKGIKHPKKIFDKYYREALESKGIGLGLFIVKRIADLHGIAIDVESTIGKGSRFTLDLGAITTHKLHK